jgi:N-methylhydantoinase B/oxoprolinase/acetone carboxylase alpha subunit
MAGGIMADGNGCDAAENFQEGLRIPPLRLYDRAAEILHQVLG